MNSRSLRPVLAVAATAAALIAVQPAPRAQGQAQRGPAVEKTFGEGLPRDIDRIVFADAQYPDWPLTPAQQAYASIDGARMKRHVVALAQIALKDRDAGHPWWGRLPGTVADREGQAYMTREFESLGLSVEHFPYTMPEDWRPTAFSGRYTSAGKTIDLQTIFPVADTRATGAQGITAEAI